MSRFEPWSRLPAGELWLALALVVSLVGLWRTLDPRSPRPVRGFASNTSASAVLDFALVFPIFTLVILVLIQLALLIHARLVVNYAAFAACRSAVVWLEEGEGVAQQRAEQAAAVGILAIAPGAGVLGGGVLSALDVAPLYLHSGAGLGDLGRRIARGGTKLDQARRSTRVTIDCPDGGLGPHDPVTVVVEHDFYLSVPYADRLFRDPGLGPLGLPSTPIRERYTLTHEGRVRSR